MSTTTSRRKRPGGTRERMIDGAIDLLRRQGVAATTVDRVLAHTGAPRGSMYYHFPDGREQLIDEAVERAGVLMSGIIDAATQHENPLTGIDEFFELWKNRVRDSDYASGCPIVAVTVDAEPGSEHRVAHAGEVFKGWQAAFAEMLTNSGIEPARSRRLASLIVAAEEGAVLLARAQRDVRPIDDVAEEIHELLRHTLEERPAGAPMQGEAR